MGSLGRGLNPRPEQKCLRLNHFGHGENIYGAKECVLVCLVVVIVELKIRSDNVVNDNLEFDFFG